MTELCPVEFQFQSHIKWEEWKQDCIPHLQHATTLKIPHLPQLLPHEGVCAIVGAAPSVQGYVDQIKSIAEGKFNRILSVNGAHAWLLKQQIPPHIHVISEMDLDDIRVALGGDPHPEVTYYVASYCNPVLFEQLKEHRCVLWHSYCWPQGYQQAIATHFPGEFMVGGGFCTFFKSMIIPIVLGYRELELFGVDSSFEGSSHVGGYVLANKEPRVTVWGANPSHTKVKKFTTQGGLAFQASEFVEFCKNNQANLRLRIHGDGLLRYIHESRYPEQYL